MANRRRQRVPPPLGAEHDFDHAIDRQAGGNAPASGDAGILAADEHEGLLVIRDGQGRQKASTNDVRQIDRTKAFDEVGPSPAG